MREELAAERAALEARAAEAAQAADSLAADLETEQTARVAAERTVEAMRTELGAVAVAEAQFQTLTEAVAQERQTLRDEINRAQTAADTPG